MRNNNNSILKNIILKTVFTLISTGILTAMIVYLYKKEKYGTYSSFLNYNICGPQICNLTLTRQFTILKTEKDKYYVRICSMEDNTTYGYLYGKRNNIYIYDKFYTEFTDSCLAKNFAVTFLKENGLMSHKPENKPI